MLYFLTLHPALGCFVTKALPRPPHSLSPCLPHPHFIQSQPPSPPTPPGNRDDILDTKWGRDAVTAAWENPGEQTKPGVLWGAGGGEDDGLMEWRNRQTEMKPPRRLVSNSIDQALPSLGFQTEPDSKRLKYGPRAYS